MTTREKVKEMLTSKGLFDDQAEEILAVAIPKIESYTPDNKIPWDRPAEEYPDPLYMVMWPPLKDAALEWIQEHAPNAWFRPMFE